MRSMVIYRKTVSNLASLFVEIWLIIFTLFYNIKLPSGQEYQKGRQDTLWPTIQTHFPRQTGPPLWAELDFLDNT